jgi:hypothetical protein
MEVKSYLFNANLKLLTNLNVGIKIQVWFCWVPCSNWNLHCLHLTLYNCVGWLTKKLFLIRVPLALESIHFYAKTTKNENKRNK